MAYRSEIDGLRAIAVMSVILFHAGIRIFSGGFIGVDIFFVISGFLITSLILNDLENGNFSIVHFYEKRARRILPPLFLMMACCIPVAWMWFMPDQLNDFGRSLMAVPLFISNILFKNENGYFELESAEKPLLHTWSLGVEEQYYILFPIYMIVFWKYKRNSLLIVIIILSILSFIFCEWGWRNAFEGNFYLAQGRIWELLIGSICAFWQVGRPQRAHNGLAALGLGLIVMALFVIDETTPFPSYYTLLPTLGTALVIGFSGKTTWVYRLLSLRPLVGVGLISFGAYLWHQPLFAFAKYRMFDSDPQYALMLMSVFSLVLAYFSYQYVEKPFRNPALIGRSAIFRFSVIGILAFVLMGNYAVADEGLPDRGPMLAIGFKEMKTVREVYCHTDGVRSIEQIAKGDICLVGRGAVDTAIIGDSHAGAIFDALGNLYRKQGRAAWAISYPFCPPAYGFGLIHYDGAACAAYNQAYIDKLLQEKKIKNVIMSAQWVNYIRGYRDNGSKSGAISGGVLYNNMSENSKNLSFSLNKTVKMFIENGKNVYIIGSIPEFKFPVIEHIYKNRIFYKTDINPSISRKEYDIQSDGVRKVFSETSGATFINVDQLFCDKYRCHAGDGHGNPLFSDRNHLAEPGALMAARVITQAIY